ncbi:hypothetical protein FHS21_005935 [Phyllobacterium trifolii]|uniref:Uncharacterized protein n=1 Tax=Phyllobacterium trifolii TaxID=300193 RepID=A0A839ULJ3_9HYPH|nr:hypothetical protein [Phyllobacterium trifolii]
MTVGILNIMSAVRNGTMRPIRHELASPTMKAPYAAEPLRVTDFTVVPHMKLL